MVAAPAWSVRRFQTTRSLTRVRTFTGLPIGLDTAFCDLGMTRRPPECHE
jgi:hypothetical protein